MSGLWRGCLPFRRATKPADQDSTQRTAQPGGPGDSRSGGLPAGALPSGKSVQAVPPGTPVAPPRTVWSSVKSFFSRRFQAVASCFGRRVPVAPLASGDLSGPRRPLSSDTPALTMAAPGDVSALGQPAAPDAAVAAQLGDPDTLAVIQPEGPGTSALTQPAQPSATPSAADADSSSVAPASAPSATQNAEPRATAVEVAARREVDHRAEAPKAEAESPQTEDDWDSIDAALEELLRHKQAPPPIPQVHRTRADAVAAHAQHFPPVTIANLGRVEANRKIGDYVKLGQTDTTMLKDAFGAWTGNQPDEAMLEEHVGVLEKLPDEDMQLIQGYVGENDRNKELRGGTVNEFNRNISSLLHRISLPLPAGVELKRNLRTFADKEGLRNLLPGTIIQSPQFESLALPGGTYGEPTHSFGERDHEVQFRLVTTEGVRGIYIARSTSHEEEEEVLLPENTRYAIHGVHDDPATGKLIVEAVILPTVAGTLE
jgi:hypothetical protein